MRRSLDSKPIKPKDVTVSFSDVVNTVGFSPFGTVAWARRQLQLPPPTTQTRLLLVERKRLSKSLLLLRLLRSQRRLQDGSSREQIAFSFMGDGAQGSPDIFWDPEAGIDYTAVDHFRCRCSRLVFEYYCWWSCRKYPYHFCLGIMQANCSTL